MHPYTQALDDMYHLVNKDIQDGAAFLPAPTQSWLYVLTYKLHSFTRRGTNVLMENSVPPMTITSFSRGTFGVTMPDPVDCCNVGSELYLCVNSLKDSLKNVTLDLPASNPRRSSSIGLLAIAKYCDSHGCNLDCSDPWNLITWSSGVRHLVTLPNDLWGPRKDKNETKCDITADFGSRLSFNNRSFELRLTITNSC